MVDELDPRRLERARALLAQPDGQITPPAEESPTHEQAAKTKMGPGINEPLR